VKIVIITGSGGLIGSQSVKFFSRKFDLVVGIDNDQRSYFFGDGASTRLSTEKLLEDFQNFQTECVDIREGQQIDNLFRKYGSDVKLVVHTAAQPSHDWAAKEPLTDFTINANGTLNLLEATRLNCPDAVFLFTSTNKVYGDTPNALPLVELETRWELSPEHPFYEHGIDETMSIDQSKHSLFGASKVSADILVQEYGRYFGMRTGVFRGGCLTGPNHAGAELHGFLSYLMKCCATGTQYTIFGYKGKQVRDNIHSHDLVSMLDEFYQAPRLGEVYNVGGGRFSNCSMLEAIAMCEEISGKTMNYTYSDVNRSGDHIWYISDTRKFQKDFPSWKQRFDCKEILSEIHESQC
jgi:CDP-paratose 2-epimerase